MVHQKVPKLYFQSQFPMSKINEIFSKKNHLRMSILEAIFEPLYFLKSCSIFEELVLPAFSKYTMDSFEYINFWLKNLFLGPTIFKIPQPN
jgi:hypothetical protein